MKSLLKVLVLVAIAGWSGKAVADSVPDNPIPHQLNVQGVLRNAGGEVVNGTYNMVFSLWDQQTGGSGLFNSGSQSITVTGGVFNTYLNLGTTDPFKNRDSVWLQIQIGSDPPLPRRPITAVGFAYQAEHAEVCDEAAAADSLVCTGCVGDTQLGINYAGSTSKGGPATSLSCTGCIGSTHLADGGIATIDIGDLQVTTGKIAAQAVTRAKIANNAVGTQQIENGQVMTDDLADGAVTTAKLAGGAVTAPKLGVNWALGVSAGGDAAGLQCAGECVQPGEVSFPYALGKSKGGKADDLDCSDKFETPPGGGVSGCVSSSEVNFFYAGSSSKGGPATSLSCSDCITAGMVQFNYAGALSAGGPAKDLDCSPTGCVGDSDLGVAYALGVSKGGAAADLVCSGCVQDSDLQLTYAYGDASHRATNVECSGCIGASDIGAGVITDAHVSTSANIAGTKIAAGTTSARGTLRVGTGLTLSGDQVNVAFAGGGSANTAARSDHTHSGFLNDGGPFHLNQGNGFIFVDPDAPAPNEVYLHNPSGASSVVVELRLTHPGGAADTSREFRIKTESSNINAYTHRFYENGAAYHYGTLTLGGSLSCTNCVDSTAITNGTITDADIANVSGSKISSGTSINLDTGDLTARYVYAYQFYDRDNTGYYMNPAGDSQVSSIYANNWFRAQGQTGLYFQDYGGGWHMTDSTWIRAYNGKPVYSAGEIQSGSNMRAPIFYDLNDGGYYVDPNSNSRMASLYVNNNLINWPGYGAGIVQAPGAYTYPGRVDGGSWQTSWFLGSHGSYGLYTNTGFYMAGNLWVPFIYDANNTGYYLDPNGSSQVVRIYANDWFRAQGQSGLYFESYGGGWHMTDSTWIRAYNGKAVYADNEIRSGSNVRAPVFYDLNNGACRFDGTDGNGSSTWRLGVGDINVWGHLWSQYTTIDYVRLRGEVYAETSWFTTQHHIPVGNGGYYVGYPFAHNWRQWAGMFSYGYYNASSETFKKDIHDLQGDDLDWALNTVRKVRAARYYLKEETNDRDLATRLAQADIQRDLDSLRQGLVAEGRTPEQVDRFMKDETREDKAAQRWEMAFNRRYRPVPRLGVIAESLPDELSIFGRDKRGYGLAEMDGLLVAAVKALDRKLQEREQRVVELEDRVALLEQVLVDAGILK